VPEAFRNNSPERLAAIRDSFADTDFPTFPLGCDFTATEQQLIAALAWLKKKVSQKEYLQLGRGVLSEDRDQLRRFASHLERMGLSAPQSIKERLYRRLLLAALQQTA
jgi:hypothetical protein